MNLYSNLKMVKKTKEKRQKGIRQISRKQTRRIGN